MRTTTDSYYSHYGSEQQCQHDQGSDVNLVLSVTKCLCSQTKYLAPRRNIHCTHTMWHVTSSHPTHPVRIRFICPEASW